ESASGIFGVGDHQINMVGLDQLGQVVAQNLASRASEDVAHEKDLHKDLSLDSNISGAGLGQHLAIDPVVHFTRMMHVHRVANGYADSAFGHTHAAFRVQRGNGHGLEHV